MRLWVINLNVGMYSLVSKGRAGRHAWMVVNGMHMMWMRVGRRMVMVMRKGMPRMPNVTVRVVVAWMGHVVVIVHVIHGYDPFRRFWWRYNNV